MDTIGKIYSPETIEDSPFPQDELTSLSVSQPSSKGVYGPSNIKSTPLPKRIISHDTIGSALNTKSKRILQEFQFTESGAIQIGKFEAGISGDTRISSNGLVMRNKSGNITIAQDGDTGDAIFAGQVRAGSTIVSDTIVTEQSSSGNGRTVYYNDGIPSIVIGDPS